MKVIILILMCAMCAGCATHKAPGTDSVILFRVFPEDMEPRELTQEEMLAIVHEANIQRQ
jgi:hypothetical protein